MCTVHSVLPYADDSPPMISIMLFLLAGCARAETPLSALSLQIEVDGRTHTLELSSPDESVRQAVIRFALGPGKGLSTNDLLSIEAAAHENIAKNLKDRLDQMGNAGSFEVTSNRQVDQSEYQIFREDELFVEQWRSRILSSDQSRQYADVLANEPLARLMLQANRLQGTAEWILEHQNKEKPTIPKHMHFIWTGGQTELDKFEKELPESDKRQKFNQWRQTCIDLHSPGWGHTLWDTKKMRSLVEESFNWMLPQYDAIDMDIKRTDIARLLILVKYGGVYVDIDFECLKPFDSEIIHQKDWDVILAEHKTNLPMSHRLKGRELPNAFMASVPKHPLLWTILIEVLRRDRLNPGGYVTHTTGPHVFSEVVFDFIGEKGFPQARVHVLPIHVLFPCYCLDKEDMRKDALCVKEGTCAKLYPESLAVHHYAASWYDDVMAQMNRKR